MPRPALLLDVDGVLNPHGTVGCPQGFTEYDLFPGEEPVRRPAVWLDDLHPLRRAQRCTAAIGARPGRISRRAVGSWGRPPTG